MHMMSMRRIKRIPINIITTITMITTIITRLKVRLAVVVVGEIIVVVGVQSSVGQPAVESQI